MTDDHETIFLEPACAINSDEGRQWCEDDVWGECDDCGMPSVAYIQRDHALSLVAEALEEAEGLADIHSKWAADEIWNYRRTQQGHALAAREARDKRVMEQATVEFSEMAASLVEDMSRKPETTWGQVKGAIRALGDIGDRDVLAERDKRVRDEALREALEAVCEADSVELAMHGTAPACQRILALIEGDQTDG